MEPVEFILRLPVAVIRPRIVGFELNIVILVPLADILPIEEKLFVALASVILPLEFAPVEINVTAPITTRFPEPVSVILSLEII